MTIIDLNRERRTRQPVTRRYTGPQDAGNDAHDRLQHLADLAGQCLYVDSSEVQDVIETVDQVISALVVELTYRRCYSTSPFDSTGS